MPSTRPTIGQTVLVRAWWTRPADEIMECTVISSHPSRLNRPDFCTVAPKTKPAHVCLINEDRIISIGRPVTPLQILCMESLNPVNSLSIGELAWKVRPKGITGPKFTLATSRAMRGLAVQGHGLPPVDQGRPRVCRQPDQASRMTSIHVVIAGVEYESCYMILGAFTDKPKAEALVQEIWAHEQKRPRYTEAFDSDKFDAYEKDLEEWKSQRPGKLKGLETEYTAYDIDEVELL